jgi:hypothetical protein
MFPLSGERLSFLQGPLFSHRESMFKDNMRKNALSGEKGILLKRLGRSDG